ncbi:MAG: TolB family protein, partial [Nitrospirota bacterium]
MERGRGTKVLMLLFFCLFLVGGLVIDGKYASVSAEPHNGKQAGMAKERPEVDRSGLPVMDIHLATQAGTVVQMSNCTGYYDCHDGDWINNNWLVYHNRSDWQLHKTDGVSDVPLPWSGGSECDSHPDVNAAGSLIAFQRLINDGDYCSELWVMDTNGGNQKRMVACSSDVGGAHEPKWSPDGMYIAYTQGVLDHDYKDLYAIAYPSGGPIRLTSRPHANPQHGLQWLSTASRRSAIPTPPAVLSSQVVDVAWWYRDIAKTTL